LQLLFKRLQLQKPWRVESGEWKVSILVKASEREREREKERKRDCLRILRLIEKNIYKRNKGQFFSSPRKSINKC